ncbi:hypothetical protein FOL47_006289 [Perkinsus chesapeaki]|uniref:Uncharacterized protein n=1 Tax=Perkinsus chesapeaki TaxID=330153 RepID=A0A7J6MXP2_PERCH|nr:hypothetical protein FOL47_006289 [Perkinsus chesapeaki]
MWCVTAILLAYLSKGVADFFSSFSVEDPSTLENLALTGPSPTQSPPIDNTGFFDSITVESALPEYPALHDRESSTTTAMLEVESSTPSSPGKLEGAAQQIGDPLNPSEVNQDYNGIISAVLAICGITLMVGLLQLLILKKIALGVSQLQQAADVEQGYRLSKGKTSDGEDVAMGSLS